MITSVYSTGCLLRNKHGDSKQCLINAPLEANIQ